MPTNSRMAAWSNLLIAPARVSPSSQLTRRWDWWVRRSLQFVVTCYDPGLVHSPPPLQTTTAEPRVSVGINRSAQSSSHPAWKSFPEVVLQKPAAEEDKRTAIPQAHHLLSSTPLSFPWPSSFASVIYLYPFFHAPSFISLFILYSISHFLSYYQFSFSLRTFT